MENAVEANSELDLIASLGAIYGVSELRSKNQEKLLGSPILLAEKALIFFAWDENEAASAN